jgi:hypothetical protein
MNAHDLSNKTIAILATDGFEQPVLDLILRILVLGPLALLWVTLTVRLIGLRSFSKMASFDFVATVANGSLLASAATSTEWPRFLQAALSMTTVLGTQALITRLRRRAPVTWEPVRDFCEALGPGVRFHHFDQVKGAKAGAINLALARRDVRTRFVASSVP